jgi:hypothetical protein
MVRGRSVEERESQRAEGGLWLGKESFKISAEPTPSDP